MLGNREDAEEVTQEAFLQAYRALPGFEGRSSVGTWLHRIAMNTTAGFLKKDSARRASTMAYSVEELEALGRVFSGEHQTEAAFAKKQFQRALHRALMILPEEFRAVFVLRELQGCSYREIAEILDVPLGTVESRLFRSREMLRKELAEVL